MTATSPAPRPAQLPVGDLGVAATLDAAGDLTRLDYKLYGAIALLIVAPFQAFFVIAMGLLNPQTLPYNSAAFAIAAIANPEEAAATQPGNAILAMLLSLLFSALFAGVVVPLAMGAVSRAAALRYLGHG
ncbi:MAG: hypothetical protein J6333_02715, partial [Planctomycetes bacterium]|nr:hypothetical protein [Planctomycetota bacterium]